MPLFAALAIVPSMHAQARASSSASSSIRESLDSWIVTRYRGAQLLDDSSGIDSTDAPGTLVPRIEHVRDAKGDTLVGLHFSMRAIAPALSMPGRVRLAVPSGAATGVTGTVIARRLFRAPRVPGAQATNASAWRYGWAYLVALPRQRDPLPAFATRGWLVLDATSPETRTRRSRP
jgi:hypothetical protein